MSNPFATPIVPVSGYFVTNGGYALVPGSPGSTLGIVFNPEVEQVVSWSRFEFCLTIH